MRTNKHDDDDDAHSCAVGRSEASRLRDIVVGKTSDREPVPGTAVLQAHTANWQGEGQLRWKGPEARRARAEAKTVWRGKEGAQVTFPSRFAWGRPRANAPL